MPCPALIATVTPFRFDGARYNTELPEWIAENCAYCQASFQPTADEEAVPVFESSVSSGFLSFPASASASACFFSASSFAAATVSLAWLITGSAFSLTASDKAVQSAASRCAAGVISLDLRTCVTMIHARTAAKTILSPRSMYLRVLSRLCFIYYNSSFIFFLICSIGIQTGLQCGGKPGDPLYFTRYDNSIGSSVCCALKCLE